jgi:glycosyltransferase involved in cell wall biosynthesis
MLFTIAIPTYNNERTIKKAIKSALNQSYNKDYEILILNNCSSDGTVNILKEFQNKVSIINNEKTVSMYDNHNLCVKHAKGEYILFCHSDDELVEDALKILAHHIAEKLFPEKFVIWGRSQYRDFANSWHKASILFNTVLAGSFSFIPFYYGGLTPSGTCYSRKMLYESGGFLKSNTNFSPSDMSTMLMLASYGFEFEMIDRLLFKRTYASTANFKSYNEILFSTVDVLKELKQAIDIVYWEMIVNNSFYLKEDPIIFHNALLYIEKNKNISKFYLKRIIRKPQTVLFIIRRKNYRILYKKILFNFKGRKK